MTFGKNLSLALASVCLLFGTAEGANKEMLVKFHRAPGTAEEAIIKQAGGRIDRRLGFVKAVQVTLDESRIESLRLNPAVASVEENRTVRLPLPPPQVRKLSALTFDTIPEIPTDEYEAAWGVKKIGAKALHDQGITGRGVKVAVLDTGVDYNHPELKDVYKGGENFVYEGSHDPMDDTLQGHGTHVAGIIAAVRNGSGVVGVAPEVELYAAKIFAGGGTDEGTILLALKWAIDQQMDIINLSFELPNTTLMADALKKAEEAGILVVAAAGNFSKEIPYPEETFGSALFVTATDRNDAFASAFSSFGPQADFAAPGSGVYSLIGPNAISSINKPGYDFMTGTSQAAPHVTGAAALLLSAAPPDLDGNGVSDFRDVRLQLRQLALDLGAPGRDPQFGYGRVRLAETPPEEENPPENTVSTLSLVRGASYPGKDAKTGILADGVYDITIRNAGLSVVIVRVLDDGFPVRELSRLVRFKRGGGTERFTIDAKGKTLEIDFTPMGKKGATAQVTLEKQ